MDDFEKYLEEQLKRPDFKKEYDALEEEYQMISSLIAARKEKGITQQELSKLTGVAQADISRIESGNGNPSFKTLKRLAEGLGKKLQVTFV
ncbi:helix-turn-helix domain-containing protein [Succinivibrio dextrinosolvens]|uniref:helix-turn-helix domain-containing protein n=1 Tax=Succinivibrio dextrinosolvens TaxID=83771 RepID=UPI0004E14CED|nr:helix-turn-helix transcriptional regulator [Succinivibrio dextrinosolvens]MBE6422711.1 helix-turn-helix transcriptional regulator [Succinivibrio dextrinosolvens]